MINHARRAEDLIEREGSVAAFPWRYEPDAADLAESQIASTSPASVALSEGSEEATPEARRADHGVRVHAGRGTDQRPHPGLHDPARGPRVHDGFDRPGRASGGLAGPELER
ncbi:hypothetical protein OG977_38260 [Kitasatospora purpeofusca]